MLSAAVRNGQGQRAAEEPGASDSGTLVAAERLSGSPQVRAAAKVSFRSRSHWATLVAKPSRRQPDGRTAIVRQTAVAAAPWLFEVNRRITHTVA